MVNLSEVNKFIFLSFFFFCFDFFCSYLVSITDCDGAAAGPNRIEFAKMLLG